MMEEYPVNIYTKEEYEKKEDIDHGFLAMVMVLPRVGELIEIPSFKYNEELFEPESNKAMKSYMGGKYRVLSVVHTIIQRQPLWNEERFRFTQFFSIIVEHVKEGE